MLQKILGLPINASAHGAENDRLILYVHILMVVLFVGRFARNLHRLAKLEPQRFRWWEVPPN